MLVKLTVTSVLFHPARLGAGKPAGVGELGGVVSIFTVTVTEFDTPAPLVAEQVSVVPAVSVVSVVVPQPLEEAMPDSGSLTSQLTVTFVLFQPAALGGGVTVGTMTGGVGSVLSRVTKASVRPLKVVSNAPVVVGKGLAEVVSPVTQTLPGGSRAIPKPRSTLLPPR